MVFPNRRTTISYLMLLLPPLVLTLLAFVALAQVDEANIAVGAPLEAILTPTPEPLAQALAYFEQGTALQAQGDYPAAEQAYRAALAAEPGLAPVYDALGSLYAASDRPVDALAAYRQAVALEPEVGERWRNLGVVQANQGDLAAAAASLERAVSLVPSESSWRFELGQVYAYLGRNQEARQAFEEVLNLSPDALLLAAVEEQMRLLAEGPQRPLGPLRPR